MELTQEEIAMCEFHLQKEVRDPPIYSPNLPRPTVNWNTLNKHKRKNLPDPDIFPILSVPSDPNLYLDGTKYKPEEQRTSHQYCGNIPLRMTKTARQPAESLQQEAKKRDATPNVDDDKFEIACLLIFVLAISSFWEP